VLLFAAEDAPHIVRHRLEGIAYAAGADFQKLDIHVITVPTLRLDRHEHQQALQATVAGLKPKLLVLDPLVRLHCIDENLVAEVAPLLAYLRTLSATTALQSPSCTTPAGASLMSAAVKRSVARPNSTPGATPISIYVATASTCI
jgi:hypothetical protein